jgi:hypothetical protein
MLPEERAHGHSTLDLKRSLLAALVGLLAANALVLVLMQRYGGNLGYRVVRAKFALVDERREPVDWLILGDSSCNQALDPAVFERVTGESALNLCTIGAMLVVGDAWLLERYIDRFGPPRRGVLVSHAYDVWPRSDDRIATVAAQVPLPLSWRFGRSLVPGELDEVIDATLGNAFPLASRPASTRMLLGQVVRDRLPPPINGAGFMSGTTHREELLRADERDHIDRAGESSEISTINRSALERMAQLANGPIVIVPTAIGAELWENTSVRERIRAAHSSVREAIASNERVLLLQSEPFLFAREALADAIDHLTTDASEHYTRLVATAVRARLDG